MASRTSTIRFAFEGDASGSTRALRELAAEATKAGGITKAQADKIGKAFDDIERKAQGLSKVNLASAAKGQAAAGFENVLGSLPGGGAASGLLSGLGGAETVLGQIGTKAAVATASVAALGVGAVVAGKQSFDAFQSVGTAIGKFQQTLGGSTEDASRFWYTMSAAGVNPEQGLDALNQFAVNVTQNKDDLDEFGVSVAKFKDGTTDMVGTLYNVIDAYQSMGDSAERARLLSVTLGEEGMRQLQPLLRRNTDELKAMAASAKGVLNEGDLQRLDDWKATWGQLSATIALAGAQIGSSIAPALTTLVSGASEAVDVGTTLGGVLVDVAGVVFSPVVDGVKALGGALGEAERAGRGVSDAIGEALGSGTIDEALGGVGRAAADTSAASANLSGEFARLGREAASAAAATDAMRPALVASFNAMTTASAGVAEAAQGVAAAEVDAARTIEDANRSAAASVSSAADQVASARASWGDAVADLAKAEQQAARTIADAEKDAAKSIQSAEERVTEAYEDHAVAVVGLAEAERDAQRTIAEANEDAADRVVDAQERVADAQERAARQRRDNVRRVEDAELSFQDAIRRALEEENPFEAQRIREEAQREYQRTREDVAESEIDAAKTVAEAEAGLRDATIEAEEIRAQAVVRAGEIVAQARERLVEASGRVAEAEISLAETVQDAAQRRADAHASASESIAAAQSRVWQAAVTVSQAESNYADTVERAEAAVARAAESAAASVWNARMNHITATDAATAAEARLQQAMVQTANLRASLAFRDPMSAAYVAAGIREFPSFHSGGVYQAPGGAREGLALLESGEGIISREQMLNGSSGGGGGVVVNVYGSVLSDRELSEVIARGIRDGYGRG